MVAITVVLFNGDKTVKRRTLRTRIQLVAAFKVLTLIKGVLEAGVPVTHGYVYVYNSKRPIDISTFKPLVENHSPIPIEVIAEKPAQEVKA
ncbi:MAG: hypothetical protein GSR81_02860 [Desulfurococcales archaeon]|nr:hypothetical protein [Desulfurococcales archaeon]